MTGTSRSGASGCVDLPVAHLGVPLQHVELGVGLAAAPDEAVEVGGDVFAVGGHDGVRLDEVFEVGLVASEDGDGDRLEPVEVVRQAALDQASGTQRAAGDRRRGHDP